MDLELLKAARDGELKKFTELAEQSEKKIHEPTSPEGNTVLHMAARFGHMDLVKMIVKQQRSLILKSNLKGETPVHLAARAGQIEVVKYFIKSVKDLSRISIASIRDKYGNTPLHGAVRNRHNAVVEALAGEDKESLVLINDAGESPLTIAIDMRFADLANEIMKLHELTFEFIGHNGQTALHHAVLRNDSHTMDFILPKLKDKKKTPLVREQDENKRTPLHYAAGLGHKTMVEKLLEMDPTVAYLGDNNHQIPLHLATKNGRRKDLVETLLDRCPDTIEIVDNKRRNILHLAAETGNLDVVSHILKLPEIEDLVNSPDAYGNTPLHLATKNCYSDVVGVLSENPMVDIVAINKDNKTALAIAKLPDERGMELQKHITWKTLKVAYRRRGFDPDGIPENTQLEDVEEEKAYKVGEKGQQMAKRISFMSPLIATFTFTGAFTIPGGFKNNGPDEGMATLISKAAFWAFIISDTIAMISSIASAVITFWSISRSDRESFMDTLPFSIILTWISLMAMTVAFVTGLFVVLQQKLSLAILVCAIGCAASFLLYVIAPGRYLIGEPRPNQRNIVEENPLVFVARSMKLRVGSRIQNPFKYFSFICKRSCCHCNITHMC